MRIEEYDYELPKELIAQEPCLNRDECKLMVLDKVLKKIYHKKFFEIVDFLNKNDIIVLNNTKVIPAKLIGYKESTKGKVELLLISKLNSNKETWEVEINNKKNIQIGSKIIFNSSLTGEIISRDGTKIIIEFYNKDNIPFSELLEKVGSPPLPPYIKRSLKDDRDKVNYQTVYAKSNGSIAAPTAGLHFTKELLNKITKKGVMITEITLHIGRGTFKPIRAKEIESHNMEQEYFEISSDSADLINNAMKSGKRIISVGTSTTRALETAFDIGMNRLKSVKDWSRLYMYEGYKFNVINGLITNFHLPKSTNLVLTCTFGGRDFILQAYKEAIESRYNFYSYGDAMFII
ncbi:MAG: tRNA preQ1(34) S-adenosylmethionine ribosyltransferase-isomerase QueA [Candidatus Firestonebacteria bacterium]